MGRRKYALKHSRLDLQNTVPTDRQRPADGQGVEEKLPTTYKTPGIQIF